MMFFACRRRCDFLVPLFLAVCALLPATFAAEESHTMENGDTYAPTPAEEEVIVRLHLVRHGETEANLKRLVLGQIDSPLTPRGIRQAQATAEAMRGRAFWRRYTSDLGRAQTTAEIVNGLRDGDDESLVLAGANRATEEEVSVGTDPNGGSSGVGPGEGNVRYGNSGAAGVGGHVRLIIDKRLREMGKGAREGRDKRLDYEQALALHRKEFGEDAPVPLLETEDELWERFKDWVDTLVDDALEEHESSSSPILQEGEEMNGFTKQPPSVSDVNGEEVNGDSINGAGINGDTVVNGNSVNGDGVNGNVGKKAAPKRHMYDVLAVSHSGTLRAIIGRMVGDELPAGIDRDPVGRDGARPNMLTVPNLSVTVIDVVTKMKHGLEKQRQSAAGRGMWSAKLVELANTSHLRGI